MADGSGRVKAEVPKVFGVGGLGDEVEGRAEEGVVFELCMEPLEDGEVFEGEAYGVEQGDFGVVGA